jgi:periplasmic mercuric ion binding protein
MLFLPKITLPLLILFTFSLAANAQGTTETIVIKTNIYCDHCKECESCGGRLNRELPFIKGVKDFSLYEKAMTISITYNSKKTNPEKLRAAIAKAGFDADTVKADPKAVAKFDECCLKK